MPSGTNVHPKKHNVIHVGYSAMPQRFPGQGRGYVNPSNLVATG